MILILELIMPDSPDHHPNYYTKNHYGIDHPQD